MIRWNEHGQDERVDLQAKDTIEPMAVLGEAHSWGMMARKGVLSEIFRCSRKHVRPFHEVMVLVPDLQGLRTRDDGRNRGWGVCLFGTRRFAT